MALALHLLSVVEVFKKYILELRGPQLLENQKAYNELKCLRHMAEAMDVVAIETRLPRPVILIDITQKFFMKIVEVLYNWEVLPAQNSRQALEICKTTYVDQVYLELLQYIRTKIDMMLICNFKQFLCPKTYEYLLQARELTSNIIRQVELIFLPIEGIVNLNELYYNLQNRPGASGTTSAPDIIAINSPFVEKLATKTTVELVKDAPDQDCPICWKPLEALSVGILAECRHICCEPCTKTWFEGNPYDWSCALCRAHISEVSFATVPPQQKRRRIEENEDSLGGTKKIKIETVE